MSETLEHGVVRARQLVLRLARGDDLDAPDLLYQLARQHRVMLRNFDVLEQPAHDVLGRHVLRLRLVGQDHAVAQHVERRSP